MTPEPGPLRRDELTTHHFRRAREGDQVSLAWVYDRFTPALLLAAHQRMGERLRARFDPVDVVADVWRITLESLEGLEPRNGRLTPVVLKFLSTAVTNRCNTLLKTHVLGLRGQLTSDAEIEGIPDGRFSAPTGPLTGAARLEVFNIVMETAKEIGPGTHDILHLRGVEQRTNLEVAELLGISVEAVAARYHRALNALRRRLPESIFAELAELNERG